MSLGHQIRRFQLRQAFLRGAASLNGREAGDGFQTAGGAAKSAALGRFYSAGRKAAASGAVHGAVLDSMFDQEYAAYRHAEPTELTDDDVVETDQEDESGEDEDTDVGSDDAGDEAGDDDADVDEADLDDADVDEADLDDADGDEAEYDEADER